MGASMAVVYAAQASPGANGPRRRQVAFARARAPELGESGRNTAVDREHALGT